MQQSEAQVRLWGGPHPQQLSEQPKGLHGPILGSAHLAAVAACSSRMSRCRVHGRHPWAALTDQHSKAALREGEGKGRTRT
jgi:hypothetical protein